MRCTCFIILLLQFLLNFSLCTDQLAREHMVLDSDEKGLSFVVLFYGED